MKANKIPIKIKIAKMNISFYFEGIKKKNPTNITQTERAGGREMKIFKPRHESEELFNSFITSPFHIPFLSVH
jgi:hypothetical protein